LLKSGLIINRTAKNEILVRLYQFVGDAEKAVSHLEELLQLNSSNLKYYYEILKIRGFDVRKGVFNSDEQA
jgi:hypothetical protein